MLYNDDIFEVADNVNLFTFSQPTKWSIPAAISRNVVIPTGSAYAQPAVHDFYTNKHEIKLSGSTLQSSGYYEL